jgi:CRISPR-associated endonuclease/helicase Cas3
MTIRLAAHVEKLAPKGAFAPVPEVTLLYHQLRTATALATTSLVVNSYNTGTGKTRASLLHLFALDGKQRNVLFIAPTNALLRQHVDDIEAFVQNHALHFRVIEVNAQAVRRLGIDNQRSGETLHRLLQNPLEFYRELGIPADDHRRVPYIIVVNPDIFHYMLFLRYAQHDKVNLFMDGLRNFWYVVIDEFHYYDEKQLVSFLTFLALWQELGYFAEGRKVCLLSATPNVQVETYLTNLLGGDWQHVSPDNEPDESAGYATTQTLSELALEVRGGTLDEWLDQQRASLTHWLQAGLEGAIISNSLDKINEAYDRLQGLDICRISGPEPAEQRAQALRHQLLLATPVVDIGYNFDRNKARQNIDFVVCEGRYRDDVIQRLGRAGRVLGKQELHHLSYAVALVDNDVAQELQQYNGQTLQRRQFRAILHNLDILPPKHSLGTYLRVHGLAEAFYPLYKFSRLLRPDEQQAELERLLERLRTTFAPNTKQTIKGLEAFAAAFDMRERWVHASEADKWNAHGWHRKALIQNTRSYLSQQQSLAGVQVTVSLEQVESGLKGFLANPTARAGLNEFIQGQYHLTKSLFAFRDSFNGPEAVIYDKDRLFSSQEMTHYDLLHVIRNYHYRLDNSFLQRSTGERKDAIVVELLGRRVPRLRIAFGLDLAAIELGTMNQPTFEQHYCRFPVALRGVQISASEKDGSNVPLAPILCDVLQQQYVTMLIVPMQYQAALIATTRYTALINYPLEITFGDRSALMYKVVLGSAAWHADAALRGNWRYRNRGEDCEAIIL